MIGLIGQLAGPLLKGLFDIVDQAVEDKDEAAKIKAALQQKVLDGQMKEIAAAAEVIVAEAKGESWLQRNWRPMLMCLFGVIIANNYIIVPLFGTAPAEVPEHMWNLLEIGIGGYVVGRSLEKGVRVWKDADR